MKNHFSILLLFICLILNIKSYSQITNENLSFWINPDSIIANNKIDTLWDISQNNYFLFQNDTNKRPILLQNNINNHNSIYFDGNDVLIGNDILDIGTKSKTMFIIYSPLNNDFALFSKNKAGAYTSNSYAFFPYSNNYRFIYYDSNNRTLISQTNNDSIFYLKITIDRINEVIKLYRNSILQETNNIADSSYDMNSSYRFLVGAHNGTNDIGEIYNFDGYLSEIIFYDTVLSSQNQVLIESYIQNKYSAVVNLGYNIHIPHGFCDTTIDAGARFTNYIWSTGDTTQTITVSQPGQYSVTVTDIFGFESSDSLMVYYPNPNQLLNDTLICYGDTIKWNAGLQDTNYTFLWNTAETDSILSIDTAGSYFVQITDTFACVYNSDTAHITIDYYPQTTSLGNDTSLCSGQNLFLQTGANETENYLWSTGSTNNYITINSAGDYSVTATNIIGCIATDTINIQIHGKAPVPGFDFTNTCFNDITIFTDTSFTTDNSNIINWHWDFGNGDTSNIQHPQIQYLDTGTYTITFYINTDSLCSNIMTKEIEIFPLPVSDYTNTQLCQENEILFTNLSTISKGNIISYLWDFDDGNQSTDTNPTHTYTNYGYYDLQLISISNKNCSDTLLTNIEIKPSPISDFLTSATCKNKVVSFYNNTSTLPYNPVYETYWDFGDGTTSRGTNPNYIYNGTDTIYNVNLRTKTINGCQDTIVKQIRLYNNPKANFANDKICVRTYTQLFNSSSIDDDTIANYVWQIDNNFYYEENPTVYFTNSGNETIILTVTSNNNCSDKIETLIPILELPNPDFDISPKWGITNEYTVLSPQNEGSNYWDFGNGSTSSDSISYTVYPDSGIFIIEHIIIDSNNCVDTIYKDYRVVIPQNDIAITDLRYTIKNNILTIETNIINIGNLPVNEISLTASPDKYSSITETWEGELIYGYGMTYNFKANYSIIGNKIPDYVCVKIDISDKHKDTNPSNNSFCQNNSNDIVLYPVYPNPANSIINISFKLESNSHINIKLYDNLGKLISEVSNQDYIKGFHKLTYNISSLSKGAYSIGIDINNKNELVKFIKE